MWLDKKDEEKEKEKEKKFTFQHRQVVHENVGNKHIPSLSSINIIYVWSSAISLLEQLA